MRALILFLLVPAGLFPANARNDAWTVIGPGGGGAQFMPTISPHDPNVVLVGCDMTGGYITKDGGKNWRMFNLRGTPRFFAFDPVDPKVMYAASIGLWRSRNAGTTWELVYPAPATVTGTRMPDDHAGELIDTSDGTRERVRALTVDPKQSHTLYALIGGSLRVSRDWGKTWTTLAGDVPASARKLYVDPASPAANRTLYVLGGDGVAVLESGKLRTRPAAPAQFLDISGGFSKDGKLTVYGISADAVFASRDGGQTWTSSKPGGRFRAVAASLEHPDVAYVSYGALQEANQRYLGVMKTADFGATWKPVWKDGYQAPSQADDGWLARRFGAGWGGNPINLGVGPKHPEVCYGTENGRTIRTTDGGATWHAAYTRRVEGGWTTNGMDVTTNYGVHFDPFDPKHVFISYTDIGLFASSDGGASWNSVTEQGVPRPWVNTTYWIAFDPEVRGRIWAVMSGTHDLPRPKMWRQSATERYRGGVVRSDDGGRTWKQTTNGMPETAATHILLDPRGKAGARVLYVTGFGRGVYKSTDDGASWQAKNQGLPAEPFAWRLSMDPNGLLYLVVARRSEDSSYGTSGDGALFRSRDGAESWEKMKLPENVNGPNGLTIDIKDPKRLYLSTWARPVEGRPVGGGIFLSTDAGAAWRRVLDKDQHVYDVTPDPANASVLYACGFESSAWRSADRGETWTRIRGYNFKWGHRVIPDPNDRSKIYVTTFGGSVWHGPARGDPKAAEDIATPQLSFHR